MQTVSSEFHQAAQGEIVPLDWQARISFDKQFNDLIEFFTFDQSEFDGPDLLAPSDDNPISYWDYYNYLDYSSRILSMEWTREIEFPYSVSAAMADFVMNNYDDYFTPDSGSPIDQYIIPKRPVRLYSGYRNAQVIQQFVGLTEKSPVRDEAAKTASFHCIDFLSVMFTLDITDTIAMQNVTTDVVLESIFTQFGLSPASYSLAKGRNRIPFLFFDRGTKSGDIIRQLMQAEGGNLWIDEQGVIRFEPRLLPIDTPVMMFDDSNVIDIKSTGNENIINYIKITSEVRAVQAHQIVFSNAREPGSKWAPSGDPFVIAGNSSRDYEIDLEDPCLTVEEPDFGEASNVSWFTAVNAAGNAVVTNVVATGSELYTNKFVVTIQNNNSFAIEIDQIELWGEPAKVVDVINFTAKDQDSIDKYEEQILELNNNFFGGVPNCDSFARTVLDSYAEHEPSIEMSVKGDFSLQLGDVVDVSARSFVGTYKITSITNVIYPYQTRITAVKYTPRHWFTFDVDEFDGPAVLAP